MKLDIFFSSRSFELVTEAAGEYFGHKVRLERDGLSLDETYRIYSAGHVHVPDLWRHRVVCRGGVYYFGAIQGGFEVR